MSKQQKAAKDCIKARLKELENDNRANSTRLYWQAGVNTQDKIYLARVDGEIAGLRLALRALTTEENK